MRGQSVARIALLAGLFFLLSSHTIAFAGSQAPAPKCGTGYSPEVKTFISSGSQTFTSPGSFTFTVPDYDGTLTAEVWGGGQNPVAFGPFLGDTGGYPGGMSWFMHVYATGGHMADGDPVQPGSGGGGDVNLTGNPPIQAYPGYVGIGGNAPYGGRGGFSPDPSVNGSPYGQQPGGGGGNIGCALFICWDRGGASGGYARKTYTPDTLPPGTRVSVQVGAGGGVSPGGAPGGDGMVRVSWTSTPQTVSLCTSGFVLKDSKCVSTATCSVCPAGETLNNQGTCVPNVICDPGFHFDFALNRCVLGKPICAEGTHRNSAGFCIPDTCPAGYTGTPPVCTKTAECPAGYTGTPPNCSNESCPLGYTGTPPNCVCAPTNVCSTDNKSVVNSCNQKVLIRCDADSSCLGGVCLTPQPVVVSWKVVPLLVHGGDTVTVTWEVLHVTSCTVSSSMSDNDLWPLLSGSKSSSPITAKTTYTLHCTPYKGATWADRTAIVNIVPVFQER